MTVAEKVDYIIEYGSGYLSDWENEFIDSISIRLGKNLNDKLSIKQWQVLNNIYHKVEEKIG
jgi:hypothetical protein